MKTILFASAAAVLFSGSLAYADNPLVPNDNDNMAALGFAIERNAAAETSRYGAQIATGQGAVSMSTTVGRPVSPGFLLHAGENDHKRVENQYAR